MRVAIDILVAGLSPRGRGNRGQGRELLGVEGSIPAWAGKPCPGVGVSRVSAVYPRVGGETRVVCDRFRLPEGLSPRGRGNRAFSAVSSRPAGSIPAWAGKPNASWPCWNNGQVYPRVGGETRHVVAWWNGLTGLSPRGRGNPPLEELTMTTMRSIPAWAGKPIDEVTLVHQEAVYPRVGGETSIPWPAPFAWDGLSPRGRGNHEVAGGGVLQLRSIPAWAGKPRWT